MVVFRSFRTVCIWRPARGPGSADMILRLLRNSSTVGMTRSEISNAFGRNTAVSQNRCCTSKTASSEQNLLPNSKHLDEAPKSGLQGKGLQAVGNRYNDYAIIEIGHGHWILVQVLRVTSTPAAAMSIARQPPSALCG